jgi:hypothetical protein
LKRLAASNASAFRFDRAPYFCANAPQDAERRKSAKTEIGALGLASVAFIRAAVGRMWISKAEQGANKATSQLVKSKLGERKLSLSAVEMRSKRPWRAIGDFGCSMSRRLILEKLGSTSGLLGALHSYFGVLEDDCYNPRPAQMTRYIPETLVCVAFSQSHMPDIIYLGATSPVSTGEILASCDHALAGKIQVAETVMAPAEL